MLTGKTNLFLEPNTDTDIIIPARFLKRTSLEGFTPFAFFEKRYSEATICQPTMEDKDYIFQKKELNPHCSLNHPNSQEATFLITWFNFGCGSSREHAVYALNNYRVIIGSAPEGKNAFADIFRDNCRQNLIWTPVLSEKDHQSLVNFFKDKIDQKPVALHLDYNHDRLSTSDKSLEFSYEIPSNHKNYILQATSSDPFEIAKQGINEQLAEITLWGQENQKILRHYPVAK